MSIVGLTRTRVLGEADRRLAANPTSVGVKGGFTVGSQAAIEGLSREGVNHGYRHDYPAHHYHSPGNPARRRRMVLARTAMRATRPRQMMDDAVVIILAARVA
jgi:hypothetical protein